VERLNQMRLQREGSEALGRPEVVEQLGLTESQREGIARILEAARRQFGFGPPNFDRIEEQRRKAYADILATFTEEQRATWSAMRGDEFKFPPPQFGFGPRPGQTP
jgi:hypothetical protein